MSTEARALPVDSLPTITVHPPRRDPDRPADGQTEGPTTYVPADAYEAALDEIDQLRRTVAIAHMHLCLDGPHEGRKRAVAYIQSTTDFDLVSARALRSVIEDVYASRRSG